MAHQKDTAITTKVHTLTVVVPFPIQQPRGIRAAESTATQVIQGETLSSPAARSSSKEAAAAMAATTMDQIRGELGSMASNSRGTNTTATAIRTSIPYTPPNRRERF